MYYDPKTNKFPYPLDTDHHYLNVKKDNHVVFDDKYPLFWFVNILPSDKLEGYIIVPVILIWNIIIVVINLCSLAKENVAKLPEYYKFI